MEAVKTLKRRTGEPREPDTSACRRQGSPDCGWGPANPLPRGHRRQPQQSSSGKDPSTNTSESCSKRDPRLQDEQAAMGDRSETQKRLWQPRPFRQMGAFRRGPRTNTLHEYLAIGRHAKIRLTSQASILNANISVALVVRAWTNPNACGLISSGAIPQNNRSLSKSDQLAGSERAKADPKPPRRATPSLSMRTFL